MRSIKPSMLNIRPVNLDCIAPAHRTRFLNPGELDVIAALIAQTNEGNPLRVLEFGCQNGRTAKALINHFHGLEEYVGVDVPADFVTSCVVQRAEVPTAPGVLAMSEPKFKVAVYPKGSRDFVPESWSPFDAVFVDGDHSKEGVLSDYETALQSTREGGVIIFHDYHDMPTVGVKEALLEIEKERGFQFTHVESTWIAFLEL